MKVFCNENCQKSFDSDSIKTKRERRPDGLYELVWYCPHCNHRYIVMKLNHAALILANKIDKARSRSEIKMVEHLTKRYNAIIAKLNADKSKH